MGSRGSNSKNISTANITTSNWANNLENRSYVVRRLVRNGFGLPDAIRVYNKLSNNGFYEVDRGEVTDYIRKNGY